VYFAVLWALALTACRLGPGEEITLKEPYSHLIGARYEVITDNLYAYGVYESLNPPKKLSYVELVPLLLDGPEFAFRRTIPKGEVVTILSAWAQSTSFETRVYYLVDVHDADLPPNIPIRLKLSRGNEGTGAELNPAMYAKLPKVN
jgi:hypothetical protein